MKFFIIKNAFLKFFLIKRENNLISQNQHQEIEFYKNGKMHNEKNAAHFGLFGIKLYALDNVVLKDNNEISSKEEWRKYAKKIKKLNTFL